MKGGRIMPLFISALIICLFGEVMGEMLIYSMFIV